MHQCANTETPSQGIVTKTIQNHHDMRCLLTITSIPKHLPTPINDHSESSAIPICSHAMYVLTLQTHQVPTSAPVYPTKVPSHPNTLPPSSSWPKLLTRRNDLQRTSRPVTTLLINLRSPPLETLHVSRIHEPKENNHKPKCQSTVESRTQRHCIFRPPFSRSSLDLIIKDKTHQCPH